MTNNEKFYDEEIAPRLAEVVELCKKHGMPMLAAVYYDGPESEASGLTQAHPPDVKVSPDWFLLRKAWEARGNIDALCMGLSRGVKPENDGSIVLRMLRGA